MTFIAIRKDGTEVQKGEIIQAKWDKSAWTYQNTTHPRKITVTQKKDPNGPSTWPNMATREFYANVFDLGIWHKESETWTFEH